MSQQSTLPTEHETDEAIRALREQGRMVEARFAELELTYRQSMREQAALDGQA
ncbi:MAG: hypothetical protein K2X44_02095 [Magnetospirillum sp.]|nr:hypothetical protein [Magnetospirillum sp.]